MTVEAGKRYRTPWEPSGIIHVQVIEPPMGRHKATAFGYFVGRHPNGYESGSPARYLVSELEGREVTECQRDQRNE